MTEVDEREIIEPASVQKRGRDDLKRRGAVISRLVGVLFFGGGTMTLGGDAYRSAEGSFGPIKSRWPALRTDPLGYYPLPRRQSDWENRVPQRWSVPLVNDTAKLRRDTGIQRANEIVKRSARACSVQLRLAIYPHDLCFQRLREPAVIRSGDEKGEMESGVFFFERGIGFFSAGLHHRPRSLRSAVVLPRQSFLRRGILAVAAAKEGGKEPGTSRERARTLSAVASQKGAGPA
ncbi:hypothetical protein KM043_000890 [Ampulex compressa]|nr:hypothetical protein KM043_000890 [Ampulex compressa]